VVASAEIRELILDMVERLVRDYAPERVILFGSYAHGIPRDDSDIDLFIVKDTSDRYIDRCVAVRRILTDPNRLVPLDTIVLTPQEVSERLRVGDQFVAEILRKGELLYGPR
jgi:predicted nucleotidyltransferase